MAVPKYAFASLYFAVSLNKHYLQDCEAASEPTSLDNKLADHSSLLRDVAKVGCKGLACPVEGSDTGLMVLQQHVVGTKYHPGLEGSALVEDGDKDNGHPGGSRRQTCKGNCSEEEETEAAALEEAAFEEIASREMSKKVPGTCRRRSVMDENGVDNPKSCVSTGRFGVAKGNCGYDNVALCVWSSNFPRRYNNNEECIILVGKNMPDLAFTDFYAEASAHKGDLFTWESLSGSAKEFYGAVRRRFYAKLGQGSRVARTTDKVLYEQTRLSVATGGDIIWTTDSSLQGTSGPSGTHGWKLCALAPDTPAPASPPTMAPGRCFESATYDQSHPDSHRRRAPGANWTVDAGACRVNDCCMYSPNYPEDYTDEQQCCISTGEDFGEILETCDFNTADKADKLVMPVDFAAPRRRIIPGPRYRKTQGPENLQVEGDNLFFWTSDKGLNSKGWKICKKECGCADVSLTPDPTPSPTPSPTPLPTPEPTHVPTPVPTPEPTLPTTPEPTPSTTTTTTTGTGPCLWASPHSIPNRDEPLCEDGVFAWDCVGPGHGQRLQCSSAFPVMCNNMTCGAPSNKNYCCETSASVCNAWGGVRPTHVCPPPKCPGPDPECCAPRVPLNLVFLLDSSGSIKKDGFDQSRMFIKQVAKHLPLDQSNVSSQVGIVQFSDEGHESVEIALADGMTFGKVEQALNVMKYHGFLRYDPMTHTAEAIDYVLDHVFPSTLGEIAYMLVIITDGESNGKDPKDVAAKAKQSGIEIVAVGVNKFDYDELLLLAGNESSKVLTVKSHSDLSSMVNKLTQTICQKAVAYDRS